MTTMLDYINEEPSVLMRILEEFDKEKQPIFKQVRHCLILATGSSFNACLAAKYYMEKTANLFIDIQEPYQFTHYGKLDPQVDLVIAVSQGGRSASTIQALEKIQNIDCVQILVLTNEKESPITKIADKVILLNCGEEKVGFVTKGYTATVLNLMLISLVIGISTDYINEKAKQEELVQLKKVLLNIKNSIAFAESFFGKYEKELINGNRFIAIGYGPNWGTAKEFETKFTETVRKPSQGFELEAYMHGPYLEANQEHMLFFIEGNGKTENQRLNDLKNYMTDHVSACYTIQLSQEKLINAKFQEIPDKLTPLLLVIPIQYLAYKIAEGKGIDLAKPIFSDFDQKLKSKL